MSIRLYDTASQELRDFVPINEGKAGIYVCGLTTQGAPHIGHVRFAVAFDILRRWLTIGAGGCAMVGLELCQRASHQRSA